MTDVSIIGAGVAGLTSACELLDHGFSVTVYEKSSKLGENACSWYAGGMLAPWCERETAVQQVTELGIPSIQWWEKHISDVNRNGSLVLSTQRDNNELRHFEKLTERHRTLNKEQIEELEPDLGMQFERGLFFYDEGHINPRQALEELEAYVLKKGGNIKYGEDVHSTQLDSARVIDCRGFVAKDELPQLRGVKGEMLILKSSEINLSRPVRLLHPRHPIYVVPRGNGEYMLGATMVESNERNRISVMSMLELLSVAYALQPAFSEAEILEIGVDVRPAYHDNLPRLYRKDNVIYVNGLFRHGFLLGPAMAVKVVEVLSCEESFEALPLCA